MHSRVRRLALLTGTAVALSVPGVIPTMASCDDAFVACEADHDSTNLQPVSVRRISTTLPLRIDNEGLSFEIYDTLVPDGFGVPDSPLVALTFSDVATPDRQLAEAGVGQQWIEGTLALRVELGTESGWFPISRWTSSSTVYDADRTTGFPTHIASGSMTADGTEWTGEASVAGLPSAGVRWTPGSIPLSEANVRLTEDHDPYFTLTPALEGPTRYRTRYTPKAWVPGADTFGDAPEDFPDPSLAVDNVTMQKRWSKGWVELNLDPDLNRLDEDSPDPLPDLAFGEGHSLADLVDTEQTWPGTFWETDRTIITQTDDMDDGQDGTVPEKGPLPGQGLVTAQPFPTAVTAFTPYAIVLPQGSSLTLVNLDYAGTHNVASVRSGSDGRPLFQSSFAVTGTEQGIQDVRGVPNLAVGRYLFVCQAHGNMRGTLVIR